MKNIVAIIIIYISIYFIDIQASMYGSGVIHLYKPLNYHISLLNINHNYFLYGDLGYIIPKEFYNKLYIEDIIGYSNNNDDVKIYISSNSKIKTLVFRSEAMVMDKNPIIEEVKTIPNNIINLKRKPLIYYYWKVIFIIGNLICIGLGISSVYTFIKEYMRNKQCLK